MTGILKKLFIKKEIKETKELKEEKENNIYLNAQLELMDIINETLKVNTKNGLELEEDLKENIEIIKNCCIELKYIKENMKILKEEISKIEKTIIDYRKDIFFGNNNCNELKKEELEFIKKEEKRINKMKKIIKNTENICSKRALEIDILEKHISNISENLKERLSFFNDISSYHYQMNKLIEKIKEK
ncbi:hypothetical protein EV215_1279 [Hypnocyclicus thermotrophus]|uniref:Uncharacterized protein n=1 Tax=Hypnocyclicus thermotrophus TaxID=1627895 RepID=A0AA46DY46_9FUSO|nr:hypothetical protein [Hypnocyclicus thermotrophus]TDT69744.1 hypothetical protein EV215_1279 [Hypnocyclicus thermotrophus]